MPAPHAGRVAGRPEVSPGPLSQRERQVLQLVAEGHTTKDVASVLDLTVKTAEYYRGERRDLRLEPELRESGLEAALQRVRTPPGLTGIQP